MSEQFPSPILNDWRNKSNFDVWLDLELAQWGSPLEIKALQLERLRPLLVHAFENTIYYHNLFTSIGFDPYNVQRLEDLQQIPLLTKNDIRTHMNELIAKNYQPEMMFRNSTGGSTGIPLVFYRDYLGESWFVETANRFRRWIGYIPQDKLAFIWGAERDIPLAPEPNHRWLNSFNITTEKIQTFIEELEHWQPRAIRGYASSLFLVAQYIKNNIPNISRPLAGGIESSAEKLWDWQRSLIEESFGCKIFNMYGSREAPCLACECEAHEGLHIFSDLRIIEIVNNGNLCRSGEMGSIIVTDLLNYAMPMIRYEIGDVGYFLNGSCKCGRGFERLGEVKGRTTSIITTPSGQYIHGEYFTHLFYDKPGIAAFQVHQKTIDVIDVLIESTDKFNPDIMNELIEQMKNHLGKDITFSWQIVDAIPQVTSGKYHFTISDVPVDFKTKLI